MYCRHCGAQNKDDSRFCRACGSTLDGSKSNSSTKRRSRRFKGFAAIFVFIFICVLTVVLNHSIDDNGTSSRESLSNNDVVSNAVDTVAVTSLDTYGIQVNCEEDARQAIITLVNDLSNEKLDLDARLGECRIDNVLGLTYYRFQQEFDGYNVYGRYVVLGVGESGLAESITSNAITMKEIDNSIVLTHEDAEKKIRAYFGDDCIFGPAGLVLFPDSGDGVTLCHQSFVSTDEGIKAVFISAQDGRLVGQHALSFTKQVEGKGKTKSNAEVSFMSEQEVDDRYSLIDRRRAITIFDAKCKNVSAYFAYEDPSGKQYRYDQNNYQLIALDDGSTRAWDESFRYIGLYLSTPGIIGRLAIVTSGSTYWSNKTAVTAMHNASMAHDFYANVLKRNGFSDNNEHNLSVCINTWSQTDSACGCTGMDALIRLSFDDDGALDTVAHEFTHDVEQSISGLTYEGESGALMEATSDIFAEKSSFAECGSFIYQPVF